MSNSLLKRVRIPKKSVKYFFIGGMNYSTDFEFQKSVNDYPFTTYYINKVEDIVEDDIRYRSLFYCKLPLICIQYNDHCKCVEFELPAKCGGKDIIPFVGLNEGEESYEIIFRHFPEITLKEKDEAWLGLRKEKKIKQPQGNVQFKIEKYRKENWRKAVLDFFSEENLSSGREEVKKVMEGAKEALYRSYDSELGTFLQLPWKDTTGFTFSMYSYSLLSFEAKRLYYFYDLFDKTNDPTYEEWYKNLIGLFKNSNLYEEDDKGLFWRNMTHFDGSELQGFSYLGVGYAGYPGGQGTISYYLGKYLQKEEDKGLRELLKKNLDYILEKQNPDGSWDSASSEGILSLSVLGLRNWKKCEGATAQNVRALLLGFDLFGDERYKNAARRALSFLEEENVICKNVLRDIGIDEPEGFSSILAVNAFLEAYHFFQKDDYLEYAKIYGCNLLTHHYWYGDLKGHFHPITESITPRISPYESLLTVEAYNKLYESTQIDFWKTVRDGLFSKVCELVNGGCGLSEGLFPKYCDGIYNLPMTQTFATAELLHTCSIYDSYKVNSSEREELKIEETEDALILEDEIKIRKDEFYVGDEKEELEIWMSEPYSLKSRIKTKLLNFLRKFGRANFFTDIDYIFRGVYSPDREINLQPLKPFIENFEIEKTEKKAKITANLPFHRIKILFHKISGDLRMKLSIQVQGHDIQCNKVLISFREKHDETLKANWTHGGTYQREFSLKKY